MMPSSTPFRENPQQALVRAIEEHRVADFRRALAAGARLDSTRHTSSPIMYRVFSLHAFLPGLASAALAHFRRHPAQWRAVSRRQSSSRQGDAVSWLVQEDSFARRPALFLAWTRLGLSLDRPRPNPLLSICAPSLVRLLVEHGASLYTPGQDGRSPVLSCLSEVSYSTSPLSARDPFAQSSGQRASDRLCALLQAGWDPAQDPCMLKIRRTTTRLSKRAGSSASSIPELPALGMLRARLRQARLSRQLPACPSSLRPRTL